MSDMGLVALPNSDVIPRGIPKEKSSGVPEKSPIELFNIPHSGVIKKKSWAEKMFPVSVDDQKYISRCMEKHGDDVSFKN